MIIEEENGTTEEYYVLLDENNIVVRHHSFIPEMAEDPSAWVEIQKEISMQVNTVGGSVFYYNTETAMLEEKPRDFSEANRKADTKAQTLADVSTITVTTSTGKVFDGDETSQDRMIRAIQIANITGVNTTQWKLADNTIVEVTLAELQEAVTLAGQEMSRIWLA